MPDDSLRPTDNPEQSTTPDEPHLFVLPARVAIDSPLYVTPPNVRLAHDSEYRCRVCFSPGTYTLRVQEFVLRAGHRAVIAPVMAETCFMCGESVIDGPTAQYLDDLSVRLGRGDLTGWEPVGTLYRIADNPFRSRSV